MGELDQESSDNDQHDSHTIAKKKKNWLSIEQKLVPSNDHAMGRRGRIPKGNCYD